MKTGNKEKQDKWFTDARIVFFLATICCFLWGSATPAIKSGYALFHIDTADTESIILFAGLRFFLAGLLVLLFRWLSAEKTAAGKCRKVRSPGTAMLQGQTAESLSRGDSGKSESSRKIRSLRDFLFTVFQLCLCQTVLQYYFYYRGLANTSGVHGAIITGTGVFIAMLMASFLFHYEHMTARKVLGCILGFFGILMMNLGGADGERFFQISLTGEGFVFVSQCFYALSSAVIKQFSKKYDVVLLSGSQFTLGGALLILTGILSGGRISVSSLTGSALLLLFYLALISAVAYTLWGVLLKHNPVSRVAVFGFMTPIFGVLLSAVFLGESGQAFRINSLLALLLVSIGIYVVNAAPGKQKRK